MSGRRVCAELRARFGAVGKTERVFAIWREESAAKAGVGVSSVAGGPVAAYFAQGRPSIHDKPVHGFAPCRSTAREAGRVGLSINDDHSSMSGFFDLEQSTDRL